MSFFVGELEDELQQERTNDSSFGNQLELIFKYNFD